MTTISDKEDLISLCDIPDVVPRSKGQKKLSKSTVRRWVTYGITGVDPLETIRYGSAVYTSRQALDRFFARVRAVKCPRRGQPQPETNRSAARAVAELDAIGI